jgi:hypothetical protein
MSTKRNNQITKYKKREYIFIIIVVAIVFGIGGYYAGSKSHDIYKDPSGNNAGYIVGQQAAAQVNNFYQQYIKDYNKPEFYNQLLRGYGSDNLIFYNLYYQHGFNPITCSSLAPTTITVVRATPGTVATVLANLTYSDSSTSTLKSTVVINNDGLKIDSVSCSGNKANLPPRA